jgi:hypothetical protein
MSRVYSKRLLESHAGTLTEYTCPEGMVAIVRAITAFNASPLTPEQASLIHLDTETTIWQGVIGVYDPLSPGASTVVDLRYVLNAGETIINHGAGDIDLTVSGYELTLP